MGTRAHRAIQPVKRALIVRCLVTFTTRVMVATKNSTLTVSGVSLLLALALIQCAVWLLASCSVVHRHTLRSAFDHTTPPHQASHHHTSTHRHTATHPPTCIFAIDPTLHRNSPPPPIATQPCTKALRMTMRVRIVATGIPLGRKSVA